MGSSCNLHIQESLHILDLYLRISGTYVDVSVRFERFGADSLPRRSEEEEAAPDAPHPRSERSTGASLCNLFQGTSRRCSHTARPLGGAGPHLPGDTGDDLRVMNPAQWAWLQDVQAR